MSEFGFFPELYPDELTYSLFARYHIMSGNIYFTETSQELFGRIIANPELEFLEVLAPITKQYLTRNITMEEVVLDHTMFKQYARFQSTDGRKAFFKMLCDATGYYYTAGVTMHHKGENSTLKYCPVCAKEDRENYGETYWHRIHQLRGIGICPVHFCKLHASNISSRKTKVARFVSAEAEALNTEVEMCTNETEKKLAQYLRSVFELPLDLENEIPVNKFLSSEIEGTKYLPLSGGKKKITAMYNDFREYYVGVNDNGLGVNNYNHLERLFNGYKYDFFSVCEVALFLGLEPEVFQNMKLPDKTQQECFKEKATALREQGIGYIRIGKIMGVSSTTVMRVLGTLPKYDNSKYRPKKNRGPGPIAKDYASIDKELLPKVQKVLYDWNSSELERPKRVNANSVRRQLGLPKKFFDKLPLCTELIASQHETQEQYWAREVAWAVKTVEQQGKVLRLKRIFELTNMNKENLRSCMEEIKDRTIKERIEILL